MANVPVQLGEILDGKYRVERLLGMGGMGAVVLARHVTVGDAVAIKLMLPDMAGDLDLIKRFVREAQAAGRLRSEHVVRVRDVGAQKTGVPYIVMELLEGRDLAQLLQERGPLPIDLAACYVLQACHAVAEAHALGIIHRDLKPENLFLARRVDGSEAVKVLDFGIAKTTDGPLMSATQTSNVMGSPQYMSPEHMRSAKDVDARTDVWSLGVVLYELVTGSVPFVAASVPELFAAVLKESPRPPVLLRPTLSPQMSAVILRALERDRNARFASVCDFADALAAAAGPSLVPLAQAVRRVAEEAARRSDPALEGRASVLPAISTPAVSVTQPLHAPTVRDLPTPAPPASRSTPILGVVAALAVLALLGGGTFVGLRMRAASATGPVPSPSVEQPPILTSSTVPPPSDVTAKPAPTGVPDEPSVVPSPVASTAAAASGRKKIAVAPSATASATATPATAEPKTAAPPDPPPPPTTRPAVDPGAKM